MNKKRIMWFMALCLTCLSGEKAEACTGITLKSQDGTFVLARTIEWAGSYLNSRYVVVPRGYEQQSYVPDGGKDGLAFKARYGYIGVSVEAEEFVTEGVNEEGLSAGLFYFPGYGGYESYNEAKKASSLADLQLVPWLLSSFKTVDEVKAALPSVHVVTVYPGASTAHWRIVDASGHQVVLEIVDGVPHFYENKLGVLTNSPGFEWHQANLNNYVNLLPGSADNKEWNGQTLAPFGGGSGMLGLPGDVTPPSRFVRAAFFQMTAPRQATAEKAVRQAFQILNNFDIPIGMQFAEGQTPPDIPSATQWTAATDPVNRKFYYRTMYDSRIRSFDLKTVDFARVKYQSENIDRVREQPIVPVVVK